MFVLWRSYVKPRCSLYQSLTIKCKLVLSFVYPLTLVTFVSYLYIGQVLTYEVIQEVIKFCAREKLVLFADEVYQDNVYAKGAQFHYSCKKVLRDLGDEYSGFQLISLHSSAKGYTGE